MARPGTIRAGQLRHVIYVETKTEARDATGGVTETWTIPQNGKRYASVEPLTGREFLEAQSVGSDITHKIRMRHYDGLTPTMRIKFGSRTFNIEQVRNVEERDRATEVMVKEVLT